MKKLLLLASCLLASNAFAKELVDYGMVKQAVTHGEKITIVLDMSKCETKDESFIKKFAKQDKDFYLSYTPTGQVYVDGNSMIALSASEIAISNDVSNPESYIEHTDFSVTPDYKVTAVFRALHPTTKKVVSGRAIATCSLANAAHIYAA